MVYRDEINRRKFALIWGRKLFFGISWPLSMVLSLLYLKASIFPETFSEWIYVILTYIGHFGLINLLAYFLLYLPFALVMPTYYMARLWLLLLILGINTFVLLDALSFSTYHLHIYSFVSQLFLNYGHQYLIGPDPAKNLFIIGIIVVVLFIWLRGESVWRHMQGRFSNPVKSWYIIVIILSGIMGRVLYYYTDIHPKIAEIFPLNFNYVSENKVSSDLRKLYYPSKELICSGSVNPNLVFIVVKKFSMEDLVPELVPVTSHLKDHSVFYSSHMTTGFNAEDGLYSLFYSLPASYRTVSQKTEPLIFQELRKRGYEVANLSDQSDVVNGLKSIADKRMDSLEPFSITLELDQMNPDADKLIYNFLIELQKKNLYENTHVIMTGAHSEHSSYVPLFWSTPERKSKIIKHLTSHYDVMPTLMEKLWGCKNSYELASTGKSLDVPLSDWLLISGDDKFEILDLKSQSKIKVQDGKISETGKNARPELIFSSLKMMTKFLRAD